MKPKKIVLQNDTTNVLYVQVIVEDDTFLIILHGQLPFDRCETVAPGRSASYSVNAAVKQCITSAQRLNYVTRNKTGGKLHFQARPNNQLEAVVITVTAEGN